MDFTILIGFIEGQSHKNTMLVLPEQKTKAHGLDKFTGLFSS